MRALLDSLVRATVAAALAATAVAGAVRADEDRGPIESGLTDEATAWISVWRVRVEPTRRGGPGACRDLGPDDLEITIGGTTYTGRDQVQIDRRRPPTLHAIVLDTSSSMVADLPFARHAAESYVRQLRPELERGLIATFDESVVLEHGYSDDRDAMLDAIDAVRMGSRTAMLDAVYHAIRELDAHRERPVMILLTDGGDTSSFYRAADVEEQIAARPDLTVFPIGIGLDTDAGTKPTRQILRRLAEATHGRFFEVDGGLDLPAVFTSIRDTLEREAFVTVVDPEPDAARGRVRLRAIDRSCKITRLPGLLDTTSAPRDHPPVPSPVADPPLRLEIPVSPGHARVLDRALLRTVDPACTAAAYFDAAFRRVPVSARWFLEVRDRRVDGCGADIALDHGHLYQPDSADGIAHNEDIQIRARPFRVEFPPIDGLPRSRVAVVEALSEGALGREPTATDPSSRPGAGHAPPFTDDPALVHGLTFLEMRAVLARAAFSYPEYRAWARGKLSAQSESELRELEARYRDRFPDAPDETLASLARHSEVGERILAPSREPSQVDLVPYLAAWLGDVQAHDLFLDWERDRIDRAIVARAVPDDDAFPSLWAAVAPTFSVPSYARVVAPLIPVRDAATDRIGYWRIVLPRPGWIQARIHGWTEGKEHTGGRLDLVPPRPMAWGVLVDLARETPGLLAFLHDRGWTARDLTYELLGPAQTLDPADAFDHARVELLLAGPGDDGSEVGVRLRADLARVDQAPERASSSTYEALSLRATTGAIPPALAAGLAAAADRLRGVVPVPPPEASGPEPSPGVRTIEAVRPVRSPAADPARDDDRREYP